FDFHPPSEYLAVSGEPASWGAGRGDGRRTRACARRDHRVVLEGSILTALAPVSPGAPSFVENGDVLVLEVVQLAQAQGDPGPSAKAGPTESVAGATRRPRSAATIVGWSAQSLAGITASPWAATTVDPSLSATPGLTRDTGLTATSLTRGYSSSNLT